ncbi:protein RhiA [uncultured Desulfovibrio sp.]|uniref:protein RhiA n=1 Tax=uncultured Desulfovibrio sp. TaxID=167968 RepID=UPI0025D466F3|nr:protein RhiA [uncultured Desulfovibrio sp.]
MANYKLIFNNNSNLFGTFCVYQRDPAQSTKSNLFSLAWFTHPSRPNTTATYTWDVNYCFTWSETGQLKPGVTFTASQTIDADPVDPAKHQTTCLNKNIYGYSFVDTPLKAPENAMTIYTDATIPHGEVSVGIGMAGMPTFAYPATPNYSYTFKPHPEYWVVFGDYRTGQVLDVNIVSNTCKVDFANGIYTMEVTLSKQNTWQITSVDF